MPILLRILYVHEYYVLRDLILRSDMGQIGFGFRPTPKMVSTVQCELIIIIAIVILNENGAFSAWVYNQSQISSVKREDKLGCNNFTL